MADMGGNLKVFPLKKVGMILALATFTTSCANVHETGQNYGTAIGCISGAVLGGGITYLATGDAKKAAVGGLLGGAAGCAVGNIWQNRERSLAKIAAEEHLAIKTNILKAKEKSNAETVGLVAQVTEGGMFDSDSDQLSADGLRQVRKIAEAMKNSDSNEVILIVGHTDASGNAQLNQSLSERRARNVGQVLQQSGLSARKIYFQGAGSSRPIAENNTESGRSLNRRVEIVSLANEILLKQRIEQEGSNLAYLRYGTASLVDATKVVSNVDHHNAVAKPTEKRAVSTGVPAVVKSEKRSVDTSQENGTSGTEGEVIRSTFVDFGGQPFNSASSSSLASSLKPRSSGFSLISEASASNTLKSCVVDSARITGQVKNLESGASVEPHKTTEYFVGMNGRAWAGLVNNHLVTLSPVKVLKDGAIVVENPHVYITRDYESKENRKADQPMKAVANTWEGEDSILYRIYLQNGNQQSVSCIDLLIPKNSSKVQQGQLFYNNHSKIYMSDYNPART
ncbi:OmpA family protein [Dickeya chrysanthemi]|uniref:OmpA family protein n=1 Tax=Dickeya chrysanthemi TaxID=556 RepID=UPI0034A424A5|nr:OmpA family protein [Dickeya chrysanthemi]